MKLFVFVLITFFSLQEAKPSFEQLAKLYEQRVLNGTKVIDQEILESHYVYWSSRTQSQLKKEEARALFQFLATCHLEKKYALSSKLIEHPAGFVQSNFQEGTWEREVIDYLNYINGFAVSGQTNIPYLRKKVKRFEEFTSQDQEWLALASDRLGRTYYDSNKYDSAAYFLEKAGSIMAKHQMNLYLANNLTMQGVLWDAKEQFDKSAQCYEASLKVLEKLVQPPLGTLGANAYNVGLIYEDRYGNGLKGLPFYTKALSYDVQGGEDALGIVSEDYAAIARCYLREGDILHAEKYALLATDMAQQINSSAGFEYAKALLVSADVLGYKHQLDEGLRQAKEALSIFESIEKSYKYDLRRQKAMAFNLLGKLYVKSNRHADAQEYYLKAVAIAQEISRDIYLLEAYPGLIDSAIQDEDWFTALKYWEAWGVVIKSKFAEATYHIQLHRLAGIEINLKSKLPSSSGLIVSAEIQDFLGQSNLTSDLYLKGLLLKTIWLAQRDRPISDVEAHLNEVQTSLYEYLNFQHHVVNAAFQSPNLKLLLKEVLLLGLKYQSLFEGEEGKLAMFNLVSFNKSLGSIPKRNLQHAYNEAHKSLIENEKSVSERFAEVSFMIYAHEIGQKKIPMDQLQKLAREVEVLEAELVILREQLKSKVASYFYSYFVSPLISLKDLHQSIHKGDLWIETFVYEETVIAMIANKDGLSFKSLALDKNLKESWSTQRSTGSRLLTAENLFVWEDIFGVELQKVDRLIYVPDGWLAMFPIDMFTYEGRPLVFSKRVNYDVNLLDRIRRVTVKRSGDKVFWAGFAPAYKDRQLVYAAEEVQRIHQLMKGKSYIGESVTKDLFKSEAAQASVFHLAAHGHSELSNPGYNALVFGDDLEDYLTVNEIYDWSLNADLGVLSACGSGVVNNNQGAGILSLGRAFNYAGVPSLVISLWEIPDKQSAIIMQLFYTNLMKGLSKSESLRQAKLSYLAQTEDEYLRHPYYWAGLVLIGSDEYSDTKKINWFLIGLSLLALLLILRKFFQK
ncbi:CHAT domain-containing protein [Belliella sp. R4-6]|uniref:CHAT domain-containing protein n=1 Tax=Belliella alkalica TaxID=1730871 RepID=A0ABS9V7Q0_9BACT|nr:CHAT domain-containing protein [Belliella alkalica]MCH7412442.1 CHAT domain-containing protein [Belliella alkalica]